MKNLLEILLGEYHYTLTKDYQQLITRHGEHWRDETGDNLIYSMAQRIKDLEEELSLSEKVFDEVNQGCFSYEEILEKLKEER